MNNQIDVYAVVTKLIGRVSPVGETNEDERRFENLKKLTELVDALLMDINDIAINRNRVEYSIKKAGVFANEFMEELR